MRKPKFYWDSNLFIALLMNEQRPPGEMEGLLEVVALADAQDCFLLTSVITKSEVLDRGTADVRERFGRILERPNFEFADVTERISDAAADFREAFGLPLPDATHLATAVLYEVDEMHTFDSDDLLGLDGHPLLRGVKVLKPSAPQKILDLGVD